MVPIRVTGFNVFCLCLELSPQNESNSMCPNKELKTPWFKLLYYFGLATTPNIARLLIACAWLSTASLLCSLCWMRYSICLNDILFVYVHATKLSVGDLSIGNRNEPLRKVSHHHSLSFSVCSIRWQCYQIEHWHISQVKHSDNLNSSRKRHACNSPTPSPLAAKKLINFYWKILHLMAKFCLRDLLTSVTATTFQIHFTTHS